MLSNKKSPHKWISLVIPAWRSHFVVEKVQRSNISLAEFTRFRSYTFTCGSMRAHPQKGWVSAGKVKSGSSSSLRSSPPAAKLGAGVEKSPGPSLFMLRVWSSNVVGATGLRPVATLSFGLHAPLGFRLLSSPIDIPEWEQRLRRSRTRPETLG